MAPLTWLFARFFIKAYTSRSRRRSAGAAAKDLAEAAENARRSTESQIEEKGKELEDEVARAKDRVSEGAADRIDSLRKDVQSLKDGTWNDGRTVRQKASDYEGKLKDAAEKAKEEARRLTNGGGSGSGSPRRPSPSEHPDKVDENENEGAVADEPPAESGKDEEKPSMAQDEPPAEGSKDEQKPSASQDDDTDAMGKSGIDIDEPETGTAASSEQPPEAGPAKKGDESTST